MIYFLGYINNSTDIENPEIIIQKQISKDEYERHSLALEDANKINAMENVYNLLERNGKEFLSYSSNTNKQTDNNAKEGFFEANRLLINFLASVSMFVDYGEKYNSKYFGKDKMKEFQKLTSVFYDSHVSYRLIALLRNYAMHYGFPLTVIHKSESGQNEIFASREKLLKFKGWKHATEDIKKMPELITFDIHIEITMMFIKKLYQDYIYYIAPTIVKGIEYLNQMIKDNGGKTPILGSAKNMEEYLKGNLSIEVIDLNSFHRAFEIIKSHPSIDININDSDESNDS